ncbi:hypothetical protein [Sorangium cellulosum]|uniref:Uncharacterized protein n=1 Tax=Sorangium cellulosum TaxID=56 RepID=A0A150QJV9_SORCE|nr:hypothetical protein [Sorangium cellulosum]KYF68305.1 hypothetical protein BE15_10915 [Sorangium cellulosum]
MDASLLDDPWIAAQVDAAVAPYVGRLPAHEVAWMREQLAEVLVHDEEASRLLRRAHPREVDESGERAFGVLGAAERARATKAG